MSLRLRINIRAPHTSQATENAAKGVQELSAILQNWTHRLQHIHQILLRIQERLALLRHRLNLTRLQRAHRLCHCGRHVHEGTLLYLTRELAELKETG